MNRREFLKLGSAAIAAATFPKLASTADAVEPNTVSFSVTGLNADGDRVTVMPANFWAEFNPAHRYGNSLPLTYKPPPSLRKKLVEILYRDMVKNVPPGYRDRVQIVQPPKTDYGQRAGIAWLYLPPGDGWAG